MKSISVIAFVGLSCLLLFANPHACGQAEINPDHYEAAGSQAQSPKTVANSLPARIHYVGNFNLPHGIQCEGKKLRPGAYWLSLDSDGQTVRITLDRKDQLIKIEGVRQRQERYQGNDALVVEGTGAKRRLSAIHVAHLDLVLPTSGDPEHQSVADLRNVERLPVVLANSK